MRPARASRAAGPGRRGAARGPQAPLWVALGLVSLLGGRAARPAIAQVKEPKEPGDLKARRVKPHPKPEPQVKKLRSTQAKQASDDPREDKMRRPKPKAPKPPKDYLPHRILSSFAQEVGSRREQARVVKVVADDAISRAKKVRDAEVSRAKAEYERVQPCLQAKKPQRTRLTWSALLWEAAERAVRPEVSKRRAKQALELATEAPLWVALGLVSLLGGRAARPAIAQVKEPKEPGDLKARRVKPHPKPEPQVKKLRSTQAKQASDDPREDKMRRPKPKAPKPPKDYLPHRILSSFAQEVGSRREQARVVKVVADDAISRAKKVRDAEVSRAKAEYERVCELEEEQRA
ncbi:unnamed protein product [Prorocentrum cordatum]|uniref:Uncharacterized protein n=1 Tax=Prorocentrum cordatum TaxID=2364126 RepID=A0ABN9Q663_9DINO|nr:unnamed protein product [Polarella glacialis]